jgi:polysaccharide deacetylase family protein (PEP-CTERM system associated)
LDILAEEGFEVDSSIYPIYHDRYGIPGAKTHLHRLHTGSGQLWEFPPAVVRLAGMNFPVSGGGYFRLYPLGMSTRLLQGINAEQRPFVFYIHPWELDPQQPRLSAGTLLARMRHYVNLTTTERKLDRLLRCFRFARVSDVIAAATPQPAGGSHAFESAPQQAQTGI